MNHIEFLEKLEKVDISGLQLNKTDQLVYKATIALELPKRNAIVIENVAFEDKRFYAPLIPYGIVPNVYTKEMPKIFKVLETEHDIEPLSNTSRLSKVFIKEPIKSIEDYIRITDKIKETYGCGLANYVPDLIERYNKESRLRKLDEDLIEYNLFELENLPQYQGMDSYFSYVNWIAETINKMSDYEGLLVTANEFIKTDVVALTIIFSKTGKKIVIVNDTLKLDFLNVLSRMYVSEAYLIEDRCEKLKRYYNVGIMIDKMGSNFNYVVFNERPTYKLKQVTLIPFKYVVSYRKTKEIKNSAIISHDMDTSDLLPIREYLSTPDEIKDAISLFAMVLKYKKVVSIKNLFATEIDGQKYIGYGSLELDRCKADIIDVDCETIRTDVDLDLNKLSRVFPLGVLYDADRDFLLSIFKKFNQLYDFQHRGIALRMGFSKGENIYLAGVETTFLYNYCTHGMNSTIPTNKEKTVPDLNNQRDFECLLGCDCYSKVRNTLQIKFANKWSLSGFYMDGQNQQLNIFGGFNRELPITVNSTVFGNVFYEYKTNLEIIEDNEERNTIDEEETQEIVIENKIEDEPEFDDISYTVEDYDTEE